jgi:hypothetical protein
MRRTLALWLLLFGAYAATVGIDDHVGDEPRYLLAADTLAEDRQLDEPYGVGFPLLILPPWRLGGADSVELFLAAVAALALAIAYRLALRVAPDPWALAAAATAGLSAPLLASSTAVYPELAAGAALAGAALLALRLEERAGWRRAFGCFALLGALPWLGVRFVPAGIVIGVFAARAVWRSRKRTLTVGAVELSLFSVAVCVGINEALWGGPTPYSAYPEGESPLGDDSVPDRAYRLVGLLIDPDYGLLRWAPLFALALAGLWWLWRSRREHLARAVPGLHGLEVTAGLCAAVLGVQFLVAALLAPTAEFPLRHLVPALPLSVPLIAWGLRRAPRVGSALAVISVAISLWLYADARWDDDTLAASHQPRTLPTKTLGLSA